MFCSSRRLSSSLVCDDVSCILTKISAHEKSEDIVAKSRIIRAEIMRLDAEGYVKDLSSTSRKEQRQLGYTYGLVIRTEADTKDDPSGGAESRDDGGEGGEEKGPPLGRNEDQERNVKTMKNQRPHGSKEDKKMQGSWQPSDPRQAANKARINREKMRGGDEEEVPSSKQPPADEAAVKGEGRSGEASDGSPPDDDKVVENQGDVLPTTVVKGEEKEKGQQEGAKSKEEGVIADASVQQEGAEGVDGLAGETVKGELEKVEKNEDNEQDEVQLESEPEGANNHFWQETAPSGGEHTKEGNEVLEKKDDGPSGDDTAKEAEEIIEEKNDGNGQELAAEESPNNHFWQQEPEPSGDKSAKVADRSPEKGEELVDDEAERLRKKVEELEMKLQMQEKIKELETKLAQLDEQAKPDKEVIKTDADLEERGPGIGGNLIKEEQESPSHQDEVRRRLWKTNTGRGGTGVDRPSRSLPSKGQAMPMTSWDLGRSHSRKAVQQIADYLREVGGSNKSSFTLEEKKNWSVFGVGIMIVGVISLLLSFAIGVFDPRAAREKKWG